jgi:hypothetical protein
MAYLEDYFTLVVNHRAQKKFATATCYPFLLNGASVANHELVGYVVGGKNALEGSIVAIKKLSYIGRDTLGKTADSTSGTVSEVYWSEIRCADPARVLANALFHEFMHNKLDTVKTDIHIMDGTGLAQPITDCNNPPTRPSDLNIENMAKGLANEHQQFVDYLKKVDLR